MRTLRILLLCLFSAVACGQTATISGHLQDPGTGIVSSRTFERFELKNTGGQQCRVNGTALLTPYIKDFTPNASGVLSGTIYQNSAITCGTQTGQTQWAITIWRDGKPQPSCFTTVTASSVNLDSLACANTTTVVTPPTGDTTYLRLDGGNSMTGNIVPDASGTRSVGTSGARFAFNGTTASLTGALTAARVAGFYVVDGTTYTTPHAALTAACAAGGGTVIISPGTYAENTVLSAANGTLCSQLHIIFAGSGRPDVATCPSTITTTITSGFLFDWTGLTDAWMSDVCIKNIGTGGGGAIQFSSTQSSGAERFYIYGPFATAIQFKSSSTATSSTIWNSLKDFHCSGLQANGVGVKFDSSDATTKVINSNRLINDHCTGGAGGKALYFTNTNQAQVINDNWIECTECSATGGTGIQFDQGATASTFLFLPNAEGSSVGMQKATANTVIVEGSAIQSNTTNLSDSQPTFTAFLGGARGALGGFNNIGITPTMGYYTDGVGVGGAAPVTNAVNWNGSGGTPCLDLSSTCKWQLQASALAPNTAGGSDIGTAALPIANLWLGNAATNNLQQTGTFTAARVATWQDRTGTVGYVNGSQRFTLGCNGTATASSTLTMAWPGYATTACTNTATTIQMPVTSAGIAKNLRVRCGTAGAAAGSGVFTLVANGGNTTLTCTTGTLTTCSDTTHAPSLSAGDALLVQFTTQGGETLANCAASFEIQ